MNTSSTFPTLLDQWFFMQLVISDHRLSRCDVACAFHLVDYYNRRLGRAWPSYQTLAFLTGCNRRTVIESVKRLVKYNYLEVEKNSGRRTNYYRPNFAILEKNPEQIPTEQIPKSDENRTSGVTKTTPLHDVEVNNTTPNTSDIPVASSGGDKEVSPRSAGPSAQRAPSPSRGAPPGFEEFWKSYPKKEGYKAAKTEYAMALKKGGVTPELLIAKAIQYAEAKADQDPRWIKLPRNWLNEECWHEDPQPRGNSRSRSKAEKARSSKSTTSKKSSAAKRTSSTTAKSVSKPKDKPTARKKTSTKTAKPSRKKKPKRRVRKKRSRRTPAHPHGYIKLYCDYLGVTLEDLAAATGVRHELLKRWCAGRSRIFHGMARKLRALLVEAVLYIPKDEPNPAAWLVIWFELNIEDQPSTNYNWALPEYYAKYRAKPAES